MTIIQSKFEFLVLYLMLVYDLIYIYIYIIYTPSLGIGVAVSDQEREQGRFGGSGEGARGRSGGAWREHGGAPEGAEREHGAVQGRSMWERKMDFLHLGLSCCLDLTAPSRILLKNDLKTVLEVGPNRGHFNIYNRT